MSVSANNKNQQTELKTKLEYETLSVLATQGQSSFFVSVANAIIVYFVLEPVSTGSLMLYWLLAIVIVSLARFIQISLFFRMEENSKRLSLWLGSYLLLIYLSALLWGGLSLTAIFQEDTQSFAFIIFIIAGMSAGALVSLYAMLRAILPYLVLILMPLIYALTVGSTGDQLGMGMLAGLYLVMLVRSAYSLNESAQKTLRLEIQNSELFDFLLKTNQGGKAELPESDTYEI